MSLHPIRQDHNQNRIWAESPLYWNSTQYVSCVCNNHTTIPRSISQSIGLLFNQLHHPNKRAQNVKARQGYILKFSFWEEVLVPVISGVGT